MYPADSRCAPNNSDLLNSVSMNSFVPSFYGASGNPYFHSTPFPGYPIPMPYHSLPYFPQPGMFPFANNAYSHLSPFPSYNPGIVYHHPASVQPIPFLSHQNAATAQPHHNYGHASPISFHQNQSAGMHHHFMPPSSQYPGLEEHLPDTPGSGKTGKNLLPYIFLEKNEALLLKFNLLIFLNRAK